jgi:hypothetical protein
MSLGNGENFDPYLTWLGIRETERPPDHYRLLGLPLFEPDPFVIAEAANRQVQYVGQFQDTAQSAYAEQILGQLAAAKSCLLNPQTRSVYDTWLQSVASSPAATGPAQPGAVSGSVGLPAMGSAPSADTPPAAGLAATVFGPAGKASRPPPEAELIPGERGSKVIAVAIVSLVGLVLLLLAMIVLVASRRGLLGEPPGRLPAQANRLKPEANVRPSSLPPAGGDAMPRQPPVRPGPEAASSVPASAKTPVNPQSPAEPQAKSPPEKEAPAPADKKAAVPEPPAKPEKPRADGDVRAPSGDNPVPGQGDTAEEPAKLSVPSRAALIHGRQEVRKIYHKEYAAATEAGARRSLAEKLLAVGVETEDDPDTRYALFYEARRLALSAGDAKLLRKSIQLLAKSYKIDPLEELTRSLTEASEERMTAAAKKALAPLALDLAKDAAAEDDYAGAERLVEAAKEMAQGKDLTVLKQAGALLERLAEGSQRYARFLDAQKTLAQKPDDMNANLVEGQFYCFFKNDEKSWARGLPLLAKGSDATLKALAQAELAPGRDASNPAEMIKLADLWYQGATSGDASRRPDVLRRAAYWYRAALPDLQGFNKSKSLRRLEDIQAKLRPEN